MKHPSIGMFGLACVAALLLAAIASSSETFTYYPPGDLDPNNGQSFFKRVVKGAML